MPHENSNQKIKQRTLSISTLLLMGVLAAIFTEMRFNRRDFEHRAAASFSIVALLEAVIAVLVLTGWHGAQDEAARMRTIRHARIMLTSGAASLIVSAVMANLIASTYPHNEEAQHVLRAVSYTFAGALGIQGASAVLGEVPRPDRTPWVNGVRALLQAGIYSAFILGVTIFFILEQSEGIGPNVAITAALSAVVARASMVVRDWIGGTPPPVVPSDDPAAGLLAHQDEEAAGNERPQM